MKRKILALVVFCITSLGLFGQSPKGSGKFSIGLEAGLPTGDAGIGYIAGIGASIKYEIPASKSIFITLSGGYESLSVKRIFTNLDSRVPSSFDFIPLKVGVKSYLSEGFFAEAQVGVSISTASDGGTAFAYSPGIGYSFAGGFEVGTRYEAWIKNGTFGQIALRLAYRF